MFKMTIKEIAIEVKQLKHVADIQFKCRTNLRQYSFTEFLILKKFIPIYIFEWELDMIIIKTKTQKVSILFL